MTELDALLRDTIANLEGVPDEALAELRTPRLRAPRFVATGRAWRLGVLLLDADARLYETGRITRAVEPLRGVANKSAEAEERRELRRAAVRGRLPEGETINFGYTPVALWDAPGPLSLEGGIVLVRWNPAGWTRPLAGYLAERAELLRNPIS